MFKEIFNNIEQKKPVIYSITNYVTAHDCANVIIAANGSPIMSDESLEAVDLISIADGLNINIGTVNVESVKTMLMAGKEAEKENKPVIMDIVGIGASQFRKETVFKLINNNSFTVIKGNISEIKSLAGLTLKSKGVDADNEDLITDENLDNNIKIAKELAIKHKTIIVITGRTDIITDGRKTYTVNNGHPMMKDITGAGCMLSAVIATFVAANNGDTMKAVLSALCAFGIAGENAGSKSPETGNATYSNLLIDAVYKTGYEECEKNASYKEYLYET